VIATDSYLYYGGQELASLSEIEDAEDDEF